MRFIGLYDTIPLNNESNTYRLQRDFGFLRDDGLLIISPMGTNINGANIPRIMWRVIGSPLYSDNKLWSAPHDSLYGKTAVIMDTNVEGAYTPERMFECWRDLDAKFFVHQTCYNKLFADNTCKQAMVCLGEPWAKRVAVYRAVRWFGRGWWDK